MSEPAAESDIIRKLRRLTGESSEDSTYTTSDLEALLSEREQDVYAAASDIWEEKAADAAGNYDFDADGGSYKRSQLYDRYLAQARKCAAKSPLLCRMILDPERKKDVL